MRARAVMISCMCLLTTVVYGGPNTIAYQGTALNGNGTPIADGSYWVRFSIFTVPAGGSYAWRETDETVAVKGGQFSAILGDQAAFGGLFAFYSDLWLELEIDLNHSQTFEPGEKYAPRLKLAGAGWAIESDTLDQHHAGDFAPASHHHDAAYWRLAGNSGITSGTQFLGTTDNKPLDFRANNVRVLRLEPKTPAPNLIGGYRGNFAASGAAGATIAGGGQAGGVNRVTASFGSIGGGWDNTVTSGAATIGGGFQNRAAGMQSTIAGGWYNRASGFSSTVGGGRFNQANGHYATLAGGDSNIASGFTATVCGGWTNTASGTLATVAGGAQNIAAGEYSFAAGHGAEAAHDGTFVWGDSFSFPNVKSTGVNQFLVRAGGGMMLTPQSGPLKPEAQLHIALDSSLLRPHLFLQELQTSDYARLRLATTASSSTKFWDVAARPGAFNVYYRGTQQDILRLLPEDLNNLLVMSNGARLTKGGAWTNGSDRAAKSHFAAVDSRQMLEQVAALPLQTWNYRGEPETTRHLGPMAQDFRAAFSLGDSDKSISTVDADGVALAAIQGLYQLVQEKEAQLAGLQQQNRDLEARLAKLETMVKVPAFPPAVEK